MPKLKRWTHDSDGGHCFWCPGCNLPHQVSDKWQFNGDVESPTFSPSILVQGSQPVNDEEHAKLMRGEDVEVKPLRCHSFIRDGRIEFLGDCTHELKNQTVELPEWTDAATSGGKD